MNNFTQTLQGLGFSEKQIDFFIAGAIGYLTSELSLSKEKSIEILNGALAIKFAEIAAKYSWESQREMADFCNRNDEIEIVGSICENISEGIYSEGLYLLLELKSIGYNINIEDYE